MTATPKHHRVRQTTNSEGCADADQGATVMSMDDTSIYGPQISGLPGFREAIDLGLICEYRIVVIRIQASVLRGYGFSVRDLTRGYITGDTGDHRDTKLSALAVAKVIALIKAAKINAAQCQRQALQVFRVHIGKEDSERRPTEPIQEEDEDTRERGEKRHSVGHSKTCGPSCAREPTVAAAPP